MDNKLVKKLYFLLIVSIFEYYEDYITFDSVQNADEIRFDID